MSTLSNLYVVLTDGSDTNPPKTKVSKSPAGETLTAYRDPFQAVIEILNVDGEFEITVWPSNNVPSVKSYGFVAEKPTLADLLRFVQDAMDAANRPAPVATVHDEVADQQRAAREAAVAAHPKISAEEVRQIRAALKC